MQVRRHVPVRASLAAAIAVVLAVCVSACATGEPGEKSPDARAKLDFASGEIILPLGEYTIFDTWLDKSTIEQARQIDVGKCMTAQGFSYSAAHAVESTETSVGDRQYGLWDEEQARKYGFDPGASAIQTAIGADEAAGGSKWSEAAAACYDNVSPEIAKLFPTNEELTTSLEARLATEAYNDASADPAWQAAREKWWTCLRDVGLTPMTGANQWSSQQSQDVLADADANGQVKDKEEEIRLAYVEAHCNVETNMAQTLGDLEASYQQPLIDENQAALNTAKDSKIERLQAARQYIAQNG